MGGRTFRLQEVGAEALSRDPCAKREALEFLLAGGIEQAVDGRGFEVVFALTQGPERDAEETGEIYLVVSPEALGYVGRDRPRSPSQVVAQSPIPFPLVVRSLCVQRPF